MYKHIYALFALALYVGVSFRLPPLLQGAQDAPAAECPTVIVVCPDDMSGDTLTYSVRVEGGDSKRVISYKWAVSWGKIKSGQGTTKVTVERPDRTEGFTVKVKVGGLPDGCGNEAACTTTH
jgi:hypothetical protein